MSSTVTPQYLLHGAVYALEQCGILLRDANILIRSGSFASAVVLSAFAREELGRYKILLNLRKEVLAGKAFTAKDVSERCDDHVAKQKQGMLSVTTRADRDSGIGKLIRAKIENHPQSQEWRQADAELSAIAEKQKKRTPSTRHQTRMSALYVESNTDAQWNRPCDTTASFAHEFLSDAVNDYAGQYGQGYITDSQILKELDPELYNALELWPERPELVAPEWPPLPA